MSSTLHAPRRSWSSIATLALGLAACADGGAAGPAVHIDVAPLSLAGLTNADFRLTVANASGEAVVDVTVDSLGYGAGDGSLSYVAPCDADDNDNVVTIELLELYEGAGGATPLAAGSWRNPGPLSRSFTCVANRDVAVDFDLTVVRAATQGFFDVAVTFDDLFCSAKLDCVDALLHAPGGGRERTAVLAFACTSDAVGADTTLYLDDLSLACDAGTAIIDPSAGPGNLAEGAGYTGGVGILYGAQTARGGEQVLPGKLYWSVLLGVDAAATGCQLSTVGSASRDPFAADTTPEGQRWPTIVWDLPITDAAGGFACTTHPLDGAGANAGVATTYTPADTPWTFDHAYSGPAIAAASVLGALTVADPGRWGDGTYAGSCDGYRNPTDGHLWGDEGSGVYTIDPGGVAPFDVYCDMVSDGGGWTLLAVGGTPCPVISEVTGTGSATTCTWLTKPSVTAVAQLASDVWLTTGPAFGTWTDAVNSTNANPITALQAGTGWHTGGYSADNSGDWTGWYWAPRDPCGTPSGTGWPNMYHSCTSGAGVHWLTAGTYLEGFLHEPTWSQPWPAVTATWVR